LESGGRLVPSLAGISSLLRHAPGNRFDLHSLPADDCAVSAILLVVRESKAQLDPR